MPKALNRAWLSLGANLGNPQSQLARARDLLSQRGIRILRASSVALTKPWGRPGQPDFTNQVLEVETEYSPTVLMAQILKIEAGMGRVRAEKWSPRLIDIDILLFENQVIDLPELQIPHPLLHLRAFCLDPLCELEPDLLHPILKKTMKELREDLNGQEPVSPKEES